MRIAICDDDKIVSEQLKKYIFDFFDKQSIKAPSISLFNSGENLLSDTEEKDIIFLDIEMPGMNGIYVGNELKRANKDAIIFIITSYMEYLDEAMRFHVFRYLSKPLDKQRLFRNMRDALNLYAQASIKIPIETKNGVHTVLAPNIVSVEAFGRKVVVHTISKDYESIHNMQYWCEQLPNNCFFQTHRSYIVNFKHVTEFDRTLIHLYNNQFEAYLTRRKYTSFKDSYLLYLESMR